MLKKIITTIILAFGLSVAPLGLPAASPESPGSLSRATLINLLQPSPAYAAETPAFNTGCDKEGYYLNEKGACRKIKVCKVGYLYQASTNTCHKITCPFGYKAGADGGCHKVICNSGYILSLASSSCVQNKSNSFTECPTGQAYDTGSKTCKDIPEDAVCESASLSNGTLDGTALTPLRVAESASTSGYTSDIADVTAPEYAELRELIKQNIAEQTRRDDEEDEAARQESEKDVQETDSSSDKTCPEGKVINPATGRCRSAVTVTKNSTSIVTTTFDPVTGETSTVKTCVDGYYLNEETNRCNKISSEGSSSSSSSKKCAADQFLNPLTGRCKKLTTTSTTSTSTTITTYDPVTGEATVVKTCIEGYELNPDTNRCNKVKDNTGADYALDLPDLGVISDSPKVFIGVTVAIVAALAGAGFAIFQFRKEILTFVKKLFRKK